jgi:hypothetical protein
MSRYPACVAESLVLKALYQGTTLVVQLAEAKG